MGAALMKMVQFLFPLFVLSAHAAFAQNKDMKYSALRDEFGVLGEELVVEGEIFVLVIDAWKLVRSEVRYCDIGNLSDHYIKLRLIDGRLEQLAFLSKRNEKGELLTELRAGTVIVSGEDRELKVVSIEAEYYCLQR